MKIAVALALIIGSSALAAPAEDLNLNERSQKSPYGGAIGGALAYGGAPAYGGAHGYGAPAHHIYGAPAQHSYGAASYGPPCAGAPIALYLSPQGAPHYREDGVSEPEEHSGQARSYDGPSASYGAAGGYGGLGSLAAPAVAEGAVGYFPHAKIGGCGVPLLLSCSPNVVAGHLAHAKLHSSYSAPSYKQNEQEETTELREAKEKPWSDAGKAATADHHHHLISLDNHVALGDHSHKA